MQQNSRKYIVTIELKYFVRKLKMTNPSILILPGDGIGPEVMKEVRKVIDWYGKNLDLGFDVSEDLVGGVAYDTHGTPLHDLSLIHN